MEPGQTLRHYRLVEKIGEGGMGVIWQAVDTKLDREVAVKVLPDVERAPDGRILLIGNPGVDSRRSQVRLIPDFFQDLARHD